MFDAKIDAPTISQPRLRLAEEGGRRPCPCCGLTSQSVMPARSAKYRDGGQASRVWSWKALSFSGTVYRKTDRARNEAAGKGRGEGHRSSRR